MAQPIVPDPTVILIPWDPHSTEHVDRMLEQRKQCGWHVEQVPEWSDAHIAGDKCIYWLTFPKDQEQYDKYISMHHEKYPKEAGPLSDTCKTLLNKPRSPTDATFLPFGHIALDAHKPKFYKKVGLSTPETGSYWIKSLYVSYALQGLGMGRAAMAITERIAAEEPLNARHLLLDTVHHEDQQDEGYAMACYGGLFKVPTQAWYQRRGYKLIATVKDFYEDKDEDGNIWSVRTVFLQKDVSRSE